MKPRVLDWPEVEDDAILQFPDKQDITDAVDGLLPKPATDPVKNKSVVNNGVGIAVYGNAVAEQAIRAREL